MAREFNITRTEGEYLVDLLEALPEAGKPGEHYMALDIADEIRRVFGNKRRPALRGTDRFGYWNLLQMSERLVHYFAISAHHFRPAFAIGFLD